MAVLRGTASAQLYNASTNTSTKVMQSVVLIEREAGISGKNAADCLQQCKAIEAMQEIDNAAPMTRTLLYFACGNVDNTNGEDATNYKSRTEPYKCDNCMLINLMLFLNPVH